MNSPVVIIESLTWVELLGLIFHKMIKRRKIYVLEPFHAFHHRNVKVRFFQNPWSSLTKFLVARNILGVIKAEEMSPGRIFFDACERAVTSVEAVALKCSSDQQSLFALSSSLLGMDSAQRVFKTNLVNQLAEFYSASSVISQLQKNFSGGSVIFYPAYPINNYLYFENLLADKSRLLQLSWFKTQVDRFGSVLRQLLNATYVLCHVFIYLSRFVSRKAPFQRVMNNNAMIGMSLLVWDRQLEGQQKSLSFLVDNKVINEKDVIFLCGFSLTPQQKKILEQRSLDVYEVKDVSLGLKDIGVLVRAFVCTIQNLFHRDDYCVKDHLLAIKNFLLWSKVLLEIRFKNFVTHSDFGAGVLGRNRALHTAGIKTWYYTDSANQIYNFSRLPGEMFRHPIFCFLDYDHLVTWSDFLAGYFKSCPGSFRETHVVGCLWSDYVRSRAEVIDQVSEDVRSRIKDKIVLAVFDTTYTCNGFTSYREGLSFVQDIIKLADDNPDICILWREKKKRSFHTIVDGFWGPKLIEQYRALDQHPRIINTTQSLSSGMMNSLADLTISFPFTSTTFEALSAKKKALWHDAAGLYKDCPHIPRHSRTHSYDELQNTLNQLRTHGSLGAQDWPQEYRDPYQDHGAIRRFQNLLKEQSL